MAHFIELKDLKKVYQVGDQPIEALRGVDLQVERSDFVVILGHSGSGKTTLVSTIGGLTKPSEGNVSIDGMNIWRLNDRELSRFRNTKIGFMFQSFSLLPTLNALNNVVVPVIFRNGTRKDKDILRAKAMTLLADLDMKHKTNAFPSELSGGEQRRIAIARALMNDPEIILADEPTGELDIKTEQEVIDIFHHINEAYKKTIMVVSHSLSWLEEAKTVIVMKDGVIHTDLADPVEVLMGGVHR
jgi:putative ABC transport system ATP-binding protein